MPFGRHGRYGHCERSGLGLSDALDRVPHGLPDGIQREVLFLAQPDQEQALRRNFPVRVVQQDLARFSLKLFRLQEIAHRSPEQLVDRCPVLLVQPLSFAISQDQNFRGFRLRPPDLHVNLHDVHSSAPLPTRRACPAPK